MNLTSKMRALRPDAEVKILNYWAVMFTQIHCYEAANDLLANPNLWLKDDFGYPVYSDKRGNAYYDFRMEEARNLWIKGKKDQSKNYFILIIQLELTLCYKLMEEPMVCSLMALEGKNCKTVD